MGGWGWRGEGCVLWLDSYLVGVWVWIVTDWEGARNRSFFTSTPNHVIWMPLAESYPQRTNVEVTFQMSGYRLVFTSPLLAD